MRMLERTQLVQGTERRVFLKRSLSLGALTMLTGCDISDTDTVQRVLHAMSDWNDRVQAALFSRSRLAPTFGENEWQKKFRYNAFFPKDTAPKIDAEDYKLELAGLIGDKKPWRYRELVAMPQESQITRHVCVEGWSMIGKWTGTPLRTFLERVDADTKAKFVGFVSADGYFESIDMETALHPQTIMAFGYGNGRLGTEYGFPFKMRIPTKLGFKGPKWVTAMYVTNRFPGGFWSDRGYNWFSGS